MFFRSMAVALLLVLLLTSGALAFGEWTGSDDPASSLEDLIQRLEGDLQRAEDGRSAHPEFLAALEDYVAELYEILAAIAGAEESQWGAWSAAEAAEIGSRSTQSARGVDLHMRLAPAAVFPMGADDDEHGSVDQNFWIAETPVTYGLWSAVVQWAEQSGYVFANAGQPGSGRAVSDDPEEAAPQPVTNINWRDAVVWCNALSEMLGLDPVYRHQGSVIRDAGNEAYDKAEQTAVNGFRLPTNEEWELAARYQGNDGSGGALASDGLYWTPGSHASGSSASVENARATEAVAWFRQNSDGATQPVGTRQANVLGLFDMSGNVAEWVFTARSANLRYVRGGHFNDISDGLAVGLLRTSSMTRSTSGDRGFRVARTDL